MLLCTQYADAAEDVWLYSFFSKVVHPMGNAKCGAIPDQISLIHRPGIKNET
jgi:hypothetical protein